MASLKLVDLGLIGLDDSVLPYFPALASQKVRIVAGDPKSPLEPRQGDTTLRNLLAFNSGLGYPLLESLAAIPIDEFASGQTPFIHANRTAFEGPYDAQPNTRWGYDVGMEWCGQLIEAISGLSLGDFINKHIMVPCGIITGNFTFHLTAAQKEILAGAYFRWPTDGTIVSRGPIYEQDDVQVESGGAGGYADIFTCAAGLLPLVNQGKHPITGNQIFKAELVAEMLTNQLTPEELTFLHGSSIASPTRGEIYPGIRKNWGLGAMILPEGYPSGRGSGTFSWAGLPNTHWYCDNQKGIVSLAFTQLIPQEDPNFCAQVRDRIEAVIYENLGDRML